MKPSYPHAGHRDRVRKVVEKNGLQNIPPYQALEYILFHGIPYKDTKPIALALLSHYGSLKAVFSASVEELVSFKNMTRNAALLLRSYSSMYDTLFPEEKKIPDLSANSILQYVKKLFTEDETERLIVLCLDKKGKFLQVETVHEGNYDHITAPTKEILKAVIDSGASYYFLAHNHPSNSLLPSENDRKSNNLVGTLTESLGITLIDHLIVGQNVAYSCCLGCNVSMDENAVYPLYQHGIGTPPPLSIYRKE